MDRIRFATIEFVLEAMANKDKFKLVEVLPMENYEKGHIPGAISLPYDDFDSEVPKQLKKNEEIIVYCASYHCELSTIAAKKLLRMGYKNVFDFKGSKKLWVDSGLELEK